MSTDELRNIRRYAYEMVFSSDFQGEISYDDLFFSVDYDEEDVGDIIPKSQLSDEQKAEIKKKVMAVAEHLEEIDKRIEGYLDGWKLNRVGKVELAALRLAIAENAYLGLDKNIVIDEAVRLMKIYGGDNASKFVNGVLGQM
ncbi:MAG TPA: transcription antitermination factor NusB [Eubacterium sp.]|jgi:N utilization substance protein B|nr:transcription antitermination factor NusB [Eubacterium sp.]